jgi:hypothetical protein
MTFTAIGDAIAEPLQQVVDRARMEPVGSWRRTVSGAGDLPKGSWIVLSDQGCCEDPAGTPPSTRLVRRAVTRI